VNCVAQVSGRMRSTQWNSLIFNGKGKAIPVTGRGGPQGCETPTLPIFCRQLAHSLATHLMGQYPNSGHGHFLSHSLHFFNHQSSCEQMLCSVLLATRRHPTVRFSELLDCTAMRFILTAVRTSRWRYSAP
jgi:hypothetical protein